MMPDTSRQPEPFNALTLAILTALEARPPGAGYSQLEVEGYSSESVEAKVKALHVAGLVEAAHIAPSFGDGYAGRWRWEPAGLTEAGRAKLAAHRAAHP